MSSCPPPQGWRLPSIRVPTPIGPEVGYRGDDGMIVIDKLLIIRELLRIRRDGDHNTLRLGGGRRRAVHLIIADNGTNRQLVAESAIEGGIAR